jgi:hypothetical protein
MWVVSEAAVKDQQFQWNIGGYPTACERVHFGKKAAKATVSPNGRRWQGALPVVILQQFLKPSSDIDLPPY